MNAVVLIAAAAMSRYQSIVEPRIYESFDLAQRQRLFRALTHARWQHSVNEHAYDNVHLLTSEIDRIGYLSRTLGYYGSPEDAPGAIRERFRCPAQVMGEHLAEQAHIHVHEAAR